jgi:hypothetical protein
VRLKKKCGPFSLSTYQLGSLAPSFPDPFPSVLAILEDWHQLFTIVDLQDLTPNLC